MLVSWITLAVSLFAVGIYAAFQAGTHASNPMVFKGLLGRGETESPHETCMDGP